MNSYSYQTRAAFLWTRILDTPFWAIFNMLPYILYKDLNATPLQIAFVIALKPVSALFSMYWSALINRRRDRLVSNIIWSGILRHLPFLFFPFIDSVWYFIAAFGFHMMLARGAQPAWMEVLKLNIPAIRREKIFAQGSVIGYVGDAVMPFALGFLLDGFVQSWRWIFPATALLSLFVIFVQYRIPICLKDAPSPEPEVQQPLRQQALRPWKAAWDLITTRPDFACFQIGFMLGGGGLMIMQPVLPKFFIDILGMSYTELAIAIQLCKGIGFAATSSLWANWMNRTGIFRFTGWVTVLAALFPLFLIMGKVSVLWVYFAYVAYGIMQAGSVLSWNMSGPIFSRDEESSIFTSINVVTVGLRGCVAPAMGSLLLAVSGPAVTLVVGGALCLMATQRMWSYHARADLREA
ncbi:MAG: MFS transporter [Chlamydiales bacterium]|nr:MFS transporter [Chlamydiia bacterium]MCP5507806.1 MFS transporter [Chlamydiales bacterium]